MRIDGISVNVYVSLFYVNTHVITKNELNSSEGIKPQKLWLTIPRLSRLFLIANGAT